MESCLAVILKKWTLPNVVDLGRWRYLVAKPRCLFSPMYLPRRALWALDLSAEHLFKVPGYNII